MSGELVERATESSPMDVIISEVGKKELATQMESLVESIKI